MTTDVMTPVVAPAGGRRPRLLIGVLSTVAALVVAIVVVAWAPWSGSGPTPGRPGGLTFSNTTDTSVALTWNAPARGPAPDHYLIWQDGVVVGSVPSSVTSYDVRGLTPASSYEFQIMATLGGQGSARSAPLAASTLTPPVSAAVLTGPWTTHYRVTSSFRDFTYLVGRRWSDSWQFTPECASGPCNVRLNGVISGPGQADHDFSTTLTRSGGTYTGTVKLVGFEICKVNGSTYPARSTLTFRIKITGARGQNKTWAATSWAGTMVSLLTNCTDTWRTTIGGTP
jgi:hypothetical protein